MTKDVLSADFDERYDGSENDVSNALRPRLLSDFTGQKDLCDNLHVFIQAAKERNDALDHVIFFGPPGLGKTTLAQIISNELAVGFKSTSGPIITKAGDLAALLTNLQPHDVLFIDEIHRLSPAVEEVLYPAMEDYKLDLIIGEGPAARSIQIDLPPFTLVAATTRMGLITSPLRDRFGIPLRLEYYSAQDLTKIVERASKLLRLKLTQDALEEIANRSRGTPRIAGRLLRRIRDFASVTKRDVIECDLVNLALERLGVDKLGLDAQDRRYLESVVHLYGGGPVGAETLAAVLSEQKDTLEEVIEPYLIQQGLVQRTPRGRSLTSAAYEYLGLEAPEKKEKPAATLNSSNPQSTLL